MIFDHLPEASEDRRPGSAPANKAPTQVTICIQWTNGLKPS